MAELIPYTEFNSAELAVQLHEVVRNTRGLLEVRNIHGPIERYGRDIEAGIAKVEKGQEEHTSKQLGHYAIVGDSGDVVGAASILPDLSLRKQRLRMRAGIARRLPLVSKVYPHASPHVSAWTNGNKEALAEAYSDLVAMVDQPKYVSPLSGVSQIKEPFNVTWTVEPVDSPHEVHEAIVASSGLEQIIVARFDDGESGKKTPPKGMLYAQVRSDWSSPKGKLKEVRTGRHSVMQKMLTAQEDDLLSRNPNGY